MPIGSKVLCVQVQNKVPVLYAEVNTELPQIPFSIETYGTGHDIPVAKNNRDYIGTYQLYSGSLVFHVFLVTTN